MFLVTKDEIDCSCTEPRDDPGLISAPFSEITKYEASAGKPLENSSKIATPLEVAEGLKDVFDPEIPVNVYDLGLVYDINVNEVGDTALLITLTAPNCPAAGILPGEIAEAAASVEGVGRVGVEMTFEVPWNPDMMSEIAKVGLNMY